MSPWGWHNDLPIYVGAYFIVPGFGCLINTIAHYLWLGLTYITSHL